jgi:hypothetical protein
MGTIPVHLIEHYIDSNERTQILKHLVDLRLQADIYSSAALKSAKGYKAQNLCIGLPGVFVGLLSILLTFSDCQLAAITCNVITVATMAFLMVVKPLSQYHIYMDRVSKYVALKNSIESLCYEVQSSGLDQLRQERSVILSRLNKLALEKPIVIIDLKKTAKESKDGQKKN